jgi:hypothetical protein
MNELILKILGKIYTAAAVLLGLIILIKRTDLLNFNISFIDTFEIIVLIASLFAFFDIFIVVNGKEIEPHWKIYGIISNILVLFVVAVIGSGLLGMTLLQDISSIPFFYHAAGIILIIDNIIWFLIGE